MSLKRVFEPLNIAGVTIPNRIARTAHETGIAKPDITDAFIAYHAARARGGCGLSILEAAGVHPSSNLDLQLYGPTIVEDFRRLMAAVRPHAMVVFQQLWHGGNLYPAADGGPPWAVSDIPGYGGIVGRPMSLADLAELRQAFVQAALNCQAGGVDGVELHGCHGYLFQQFLAPFYNNRTDQYGGSFENRTRFLVEVLRDIRAAVGAGYPVGIRLGSSDLPGGIDDTTNQQVVHLLESEGLIDFLDCSKGDYFRMETMVGTMTSPAGYELESTARIASVASVPRILTGRFRTLEEAEQVLREGQADMVSLVRAQIADPDLVIKTRAGNPEQVRPCIACNQGCIGGLARAGRLGCAVNPSIGLEHVQAGDFERSRPAKKIVVVGGGPAGMEAARVAALFGHEVILFEAQPRLGGAINIARNATNLQTLADISYWLEQEVYRLGVDVRLSTYVEADDACFDGADVVIVATGAMPRAELFQQGKPSLVVDVHDEAAVISTWDLFSSYDLSGLNAALILDTVGGMEGLATAEHLIQHGLAVTYVTHAATLAPQAQVTFRDVAALERFYAKGKFEALLRHQLLSIQSGGGNRRSCTVQPIQATSEHRREIAADLVVAITPNKPLQELYEALRLAGRVVHLIGDASSPRDLQIAIAEGQAISRAIS